MEPTTDPISMLITGGGGLGGGAVGGYLLSRLLGNNNNNSGKADNSAELTNIANKLDQTNELLNELLRSHARLEGALSK